MAKKTFYGVWNGNKTGIFDNWAECQLAIKGYSGAEFKKLNAKTLAEAEIEYKNGYQPKTKEIKETQKNMSQKEFDMSNGVVYFCDGACPKNPSPSGSGVAIYFKKQLRKLYTGNYVIEGTNNIAEIEGFIFCLEHIKKNNIQGHEIEIYIDSQYTIDAITKWAFGWEKNNWLTKENKPVKNIDLIKRALPLYKELKNKIVVKKVKGHSGVEGNELADRMAILAVKNKQVEWIEHEEKNIDLILSIKY